MGAPQVRAERRDRLLSTAILVAWATVVVAEAFALRLWWPDIALGNDFISFWTGASLVREGAGPLLFDMETQRALQVEFRRETATHEVTRAATIHNPFHNPPPLALLFVPLTFLPFSAAALLWAAVSLLAFALAVALPLRGRPCARTPAAVMMTFIGVGYTMLGGQVNSVFLLAFSLGLLALGSRRPLLGGLVLGLLWLKPQYAVVFPLIFLVKGRWRELTGMFASGLALVLVSLAMVGPSGIARYLEVLKRIGAFYPPEASCINAHDMINWRSMLMNLWPGIPETTGANLTFVLGAATLLVSLLVWRGPWEPDSHRFAGQMLVATIAALLAAPHSHFHGAVMLLAPVALGLGNPPAEERLRRMWRSVQLVGYVVPLLIWPLAPALLPVRPPYWILGPFLLAAFGVSMLGGVVHECVRATLPGPGRLAPDS